VGPEFCMLATNFGTIHNRMAKTNPALALGLQP
jgi:hypothetical protein